MYQKMNLQQLKSQSLEEIEAHKKAAIARKAELEVLKANGDKAWTSKLQEELDEIVLFLVDIDDIIEEKVSLKNEAVSSYIPKKGTEKMVHLSIVRGRRFNPITGKEESAPYIQLFTFAEWQLFKNNFRNLGYVIMSVLHDPYGEAAELAIKK